MAIWSRNRFYSGTTETPTFASGDAVSENNSTDGYITKFVISPMSSVLNRSVWFRTLKYQFLKAFVHKEEDRATSDDLGVSGAEPTTTKYVTVEQLPSVDKTTNDFTGVAGSGTLINNQNTVDIIPVLTGSNKSFVAKLHADFVAWLLARTWLQSELVTLITDTVTNTGIANRIGTITYTAHTTDDDVSRNLIIDTRTIGKGSSGATLNDDKYETLWKHLYDKYPDAICTLNVSRTNRDADWTANRTLTLPKIYGNVLIGKDSTQTEFDTIGETGGEKVHKLTAAEISSSTINSIDPGAGVQIFPLVNVPADIDAHNNLQPYVVLNAQITY